jgi:hypothetical protein
MTPVEKRNMAMLPSGQGFPEEFEIDNEIATYRFYLMAKTRIPSLFGGKYEIYLDDLKKRLFESSQSKTFVEKTVKYIIFHGYYTIPESFWKNAEKKL